METDRNLGNLVREAQAGDRRAYEEIYEKFSSRIYNFLFRLLGSQDEAQDVTQQTFLLALRRLGTLRDPNQLESWIYRIARNEVYQKFRRKKTTPLVAEESEGIDGSQELIESRLYANPEAALLNDELRKVLHSVLGSLPLKLREVFVLAVVQGMSYMEVSTIVGRSLLSVKTDVYRARLVAKDELRQYMGRKPEQGIVSR